MFIEHCSGSKVETPWSGAHSCKHSQSTNCRGQVSHLVSFTNPQKTGQINNKYSSLPVHDGIGKFPINHLILRPVLSDITCDVKNNIYVAIRSCSDPELTDITSAASIAREDVADSVDLLQV